MKSPGKMKSSGWGSAHPGVPGRSGPMTGCVLSETCVFCKAQGWKIRRGRTALTREEEALSPLLISPRFFHKQSFQMFWQTRQPLPSASPVSLPRTRQDPLVLRFHPSHRSLLSEAHVLSQPHLDQTCWASPGWTVSI